MKEEVLIGQRRVWGGGGGLYSSPLPKFGDVRLAVEVGLVTAAFSGSR